MSNNRVNPAAKAILPTPDTTSAVSDEIVIEQDSKIAATEAEDTSHLKATGPASGVVSTPTPAAAIPASQTTAKPVKLGEVITIPECPYDIPCDTTTFSSHGEEAATEMCRSVPCQIIANLKGRIGLELQFEFSRGQTCYMPKWFALSYPRNVVIKES